MTDPVYTEAYANEYVPMMVWGSDHWSTLGYIYTLMVDLGTGFEVGCDTRMRQNRRNFRVMSEQCPNPRRISRSKPSDCRVMEPQHATRLNNGKSAMGHDDWNCVQDMAEFGLFTVGPEGVEPGAILRFSERGFKLVEALNRHKCAGGNFAKFDPVKAHLPMV